MPLPTDETTIQLDGEDPIPSGAGSKKPAETATAGPAAPKPMMPVPDLQTSARFYDQVLTLQPEDQDKVIDEMHPEDLKGFLAYTSIPGAGAGKASAQPPGPSAGVAGIGSAASTPPAAQPGGQVSQTGPQTAVPLAPGTQTTPEGDMLTEVPLAKPDGSPRIGHMDRAVAGNFGANAQAKAGYYAKNYQDLDFKVAGGRVYAKPKGAPGVWSAVDPNNNILDGGSLLGSGAKEFGQDLLDSAYDVPAGLLQGMAGTAGGFAGAALGSAALTPAAAWPGAMIGAGVAGAGAGRGLEDIRQSIGTHLGIPDNEDEDQKRAAMGAGLVSPLLFGTGMTAQEAGRFGLPISSQRSVLGKLFDFGGPKAGAFLSGMPEKDIRFTRDNLGRIKDLEKQGQAGVDGLVNNSQKTVRDAIQKGRTALANQITTAIEQTGVPVDITAVKAPMLAAIDALEQQPRHLAGESEQLTALKQQYRDVFAPKPQGAEAARFKQEIAQTSAMVKNAEASGADPAVVEQLRARQAQLEDILQNGQEFGDKVSASDAMRIRSAIQDAANYTSSVKTQNRYAGKTNVEKGVQLPFSSAYQAANDAIDQAVAQAGSSKSGFKDLNRQYKTWKDLEAVLNPFMGNDLQDQDKVGKVLRNLGNKTNSGTRKRLMDIDPKIVDNADMLNALAIFSDPSNTALSGWGSTSTSKTNTAKTIGQATGTTLGGLAAYFLGGGAGDLAEALHTAGKGAGLVGTGYTLGGLIGSKAATPKALRMGMNLGNGFRAVGNGVVNPLGQTLPLRLPQSLSPWAARHLEESQREGQ